MNAPAQGTRGFAGVSYEEALARARALVPALRERAAQSESERVMLPETLADLHRTGLFRILQPRRWGGMEFDFVSYVDIPCELARGCASTGWNAANLLIHHWMLALYDERAQEEVWGENPDALIASGIAYPQGQGRATPGGYTVSGRWNFSSGVNVSDWNMLAVSVRDGDKVVDHRMCLLHKSEYEVVDDWQVLGMRSTGSMTVVAKDVFVPEHRALCMYEARGGDGFPGARGNPHPVFRVPLGTLGSHGIGGAPAFAQRLHRRAGDRESQRHRRTREEAAFRAQPRLRGEPVYRGGGYPACDGGRQRHLQRLSDPANFSRCACPRRAL